MATSVIASWLQNALLTFNFHSYNHYMLLLVMHPIVSKVIIVVTKILAIILTIPGYS